MNYIIRNAAELVTCAGGVKAGKEMKNIGIIKNGAVIIENGLITAVGTTEELDRRATAEYTVIDACGKAVLPGFVDSHTHFIFGGYRAEEFSWRLGGESYMEIMKKGGGIIASVTSTREAGREELLQAGKKRLDKMMEMGITTVEGKSGYGLDKATEIQQLQVMKELNRIHPMDVVATFLGPHSVPTEYKGQEMKFLDYMLQQVMPIVKESELARFADIFCENNVFSAEQSAYYLKSAKAMGFELKIHADEMSDLGGAALAARMNCISADHLLKASEEGIQRLSEQGVITTLLPATAFCLKEDYARAREMINAGCAVALASDFNPGSCFTYSIPLLISLACIYMNMTIEETITALTINGAAALGLQETTGSLETGKKADIIMLEYPSIHFLPYHTGINLVEMVMKDGKIIRRHQTS
ncbi:imidazolonepropionase [Anaerocolumna sp. AGMB13020]|uniref:imidazolonepropionase n=1 Tax=Anaerocolumna sp. AGMB13020 TaxID=3081750 RepID=UPI0029532889|nr:imidazolonepropionase [Anaerocolumna sp. AGMB13020]WOO37026.1 imidazolonepropionase [Anaerocolumna sp. AGMB13020]